MASASKRSTDPRFVRTRQALRAALLRTLDRFELAQVTVQMIVAEAGIGRATFFRHFASVDALLITVAETMIGDIVQRIGPALLKGDREAVLELAATYIAEQRRPIAAILIGGGERTRKEITDRAIARAADLPLALDPALPRDLAVAHIVYSAINVVAWWVTIGKARDDQQLSTLLRRLSLDPVSASQSPSAS
jgi:AcrR family transcriptional regulator